MVYRVAAVSFLNTLPLIDRFLDGSDPRVELTRALPSRLAAELQAGRADVALLPVAEILRGVSGGILGPGLGIACRGDVDSVKLFARGEPERLRRVVTDRGSRSSVALLRVLLAEQGARPAFEEAEPDPDRRLEPGEGMLVIGDRCFACERALRLAPPPDLHALDLGGAWREATGLPFVFATWAVAPDLAARVGSEGVAELSALLDDALADGYARRAEIAARESRLGRLGPAGEAGAAAIEYYFERSLHFRLDAEDLAAIDRFRELGVRHGVLPEDATSPVIVR